MAFSLYHHTMQGVTENGYSLIAQDWPQPIDPYCYAYSLNWNRFRGNVLL